MTLWVAFSGDTSLPPVLDHAGKRALEDIFNGLDKKSPLHLSMTALGLMLAPAVMLRWDGDTPQINWSGIVTAISGGWVLAVGEGDYRVQKSAAAFLGFLKIQWRVSAYLARTLKADIPRSVDAQIAESLSLGFASLALTFRLPRHDQAQLAQWLAQPPARLRRTLGQIQAIQLRRTRLTPAWQALFPWKEDVDTPLVPLEVTRTEWKGIAVSGGRVTACLLFEAAETPGPAVFAFKRARPETTELFPHAAAILYAEGGAMSHACTVAREMGLPCVTALGAEFYRDMQALAAQRKNVWLIVDGQTGQVGLVN